MRPSHKTKSMASRFENAAIEASTYSLTRTHARTHARTHTHPFNGFFQDYPGEPVPAKVKPIWILLKQETVSGSGISWAICKSAHHSRQITMPAPHHSVFKGRMPFLPPNQQRQSSVKALNALTHREIDKSETQWLWPYLLDRLVHKNVSHYQQTRSTLKLLWINWTDLYISRLLQSLLIPGMWLRHCPLRRVDSVHLQILLMGTCRQCCSWSVAGHNHRKVTGRDPICAC